MSYQSDSLDKTIMIPLFAVVAIDAIGGGVILPLLPFYSQHFGASPLVIGLLIASFSVCQFLAAPWLGKLSDRFGRKRVLIVSQLGTCLSLLILATANSLWLVFVARILDGLTSGNISVAAAYAVDHSSPKVRKQAIGIVSAAIGTGMMIGPALSGVLAHFSFAAPVWGAAVLSAISVFASALFLQQDPAKGATSTGAPKPMTFRLLLQVPDILSVLGVLLAFYLVFGMYTSQFALFLQARFSWHGVAFGPREVGFAFTAAGGINIFVQLFAMKWAERAFTERRLILISLGLLAAGFGGLGMTNNLPGLIVATVAASLGASFARPSLISGLTHATPPRQQGAVMGLNASLMATGNVVGPLLAGLLIDHGAYTGWTFLLCFGAIASAVAVALLTQLNLWPRPN